MLGGIVLSVASLKTSAVVSSIRFRSDLLGHPGAGYAIPVPVNKPSKWILKVIDLANELKASYKISYWMGGK